MSDFSVNLLKNHPAIIKLADGTYLCIGCGKITQDGTPVTFANHCVEVAEQSLLYGYDETLLIYDQKEKRMHWRNVDGNGETQSVKDHAADILGL